MDLSMAVSLGWALDGKRLEGRLKETLGGSGYEAANVAGL